MSGLFSFDSIGEGASVLYVVQPLIVTGGLLILAGSFLLAWETGGRPRYLLLFSLALTLVDAGFVVMFISPMLPDMLALTLANGLFTGAQLAFAEALVERRGKRFGLRFHIIAFSVIFGVYCVLLFNTTVVIRTVWINLGLFFVFLATLRQICLRKGDSIHDKLVFWTFVLLGAMYAVRVAGVLFSRDIVDPTSAYWGFMQLYVLLLAMVLTLEVLASHFMSQLEILTMLRDRDHLTGVLNRFGFERSVNAVHAANSDILASLVLIDIDTFKATNDALGHPAGDAVLRRFGLILLEQARSGDIVGRIGGDEFAIFALGLHAEGAQQLSERIRQKFAETLVPVGEQALRSTCSVGTASLPVKLGFETLYAEADAALYKAKRMGRNKVVAVSRAGAIGA